ncbi:MAG: hypothetical protein ABIQ81_00120 [Novosphingobium sp.]
MSGHNMWGTDGDGQLAGTIRHSGAARMRLAAAVAGAALARAATDGSDGRLADGLAVNGPSLKGADLRE